MTNLLNLKMFKNNNQIIDKNNVAYSKKFDKILFESDDNKYELECKSNDYILTKENDESIINIIFKDNPKCSIYLKEYNLNLDVIVEYYKVLTNDNKYTFIYQLETDDEATTIEIEL